MRAAEKTHFTKKGKRMKHPICSLITRLGLLSAVFFALTAAANAQTTPPSHLFQLDGNTTVDTGAAGYAFNPCSYYGGVTTTCDDWNLLNGPPQANGNSVIHTFIDGTASTNSFTQGGSKDFNPISDWRWSGSPTPNKDTLNGGYAALYHATAGDYALMFGSDRASPNGDANIGIWFFKSTVSTSSDGTFSGSHQNGDLFIISAFTGGGGTSNISVYEWDSSCTKGVKNPGDGDCADANLKLIHAQTSSVSCNGSLYCAVTNAATVTSSWDGSFISPTFFEGGVNLGAIYGGSTPPCFSSFLLETRSSQSTSAVLKDFLLGGFPVCGMSIAKQCSYPPNATGWTVVNGGTAIQYAWKGTVKNTGIGTVTDVQVTDYLPNADGTGQTITGTPTDLFSDSACTAINKITSLGPGQTGYFCPTKAVGALSATNNASATADAGGNTTNATDSAGKTTTSAKCVASLGGTISVQKSCGASPLAGTYLDCSSGSCVVKASFSALVCNEGSVQLKNVALSDDSGATLSQNNLTLDPAGTVVNKVATDCATVTGTYTPKGYSNTDTTILGRYFFDDVISVTSATPTIPGTKITGTDTTMCPAGSTALACSKASCPLCGQGECVGDTVPGAVQ